MRSSLSGESDRVDIDGILAKIAAEEIAATTEGDWKLWELRNEERLLRQEENGAALVGVQASRQQHDRAALRGGRPNLQPVRIPRRQQR